MLQYSDINFNFNKVTFAEQGQQSSDINFNFNNATFAEQGQEWWVGGAARVWPQ